MPTRLRSFTAKKGTPTMADTKPPVEVLSTMIATLSFAFIDKPKADDNGNLKYSATFIFDPAKLSAKDKGRMADMKAAAKKALRDKFGAEAFDPQGNPKNGYKWPFRDAADLSKHKGFEAGKMFVRTSSDRKPSLGVYTIEGGVAKVVDTDSVEKFYAGATVQAKVNVYAYETKGNKGVSFGLRSIAFIKDGERLDGGATEASEAFGDGAGLSADELGFDAASNDGAAGVSSLF